MMRIGGFRRKTRHKLQKNVRERGKISLTRFFQTLENGERVVLKAEPAVQGGMYHPRFHGKTGLIEGRMGTCYKVRIKDQNKEKVLTVHPVHLKKWQN